MRLPGGYRLARAGRGGSQPRHRLGRAWRALRGSRQARFQWPPKQGAVAVGETAGGRERARTGEEELDALQRRRGLREEAQRFCEPVCGAGRRQPDGFRAGLPQDARGADVALARRTLDVMGAGQSCSPLHRERIGAPLVGTHPPAARRGLVDGAAHERMPETEAAGHVGWAKEIELQQLVDCPPSPGPRPSRSRPRPARARRDRLPPPLLPGRDVRSRTAGQALR